MQTTLKSIPHDKQRYETAGDWFHDEDGVQIRVDEMEDKDEQMAIVLHELVEYYLCRKSGVTDTEASGFDKKHPDLSEPGNSEEAPYNQQHLAADKVEKEFRKQLKNFK